VSERLEDTPSEDTGTVSTQTVVTGPIKAITEDDILMQHNEALYRMYGTLSAKIAADCKEVDCCIYWEEGASQTLKRENGWKYTSGNTNIQLYFKTKHEGEGELHLWKEVVTATETTSTDFSLTLGNGVKK